MKSGITVFVIAIAVAMMCSESAGGSDGADLSASGPVDTSGQERTSLLSGGQINWQVISSGGTTGESPNFKLSGTAAQTAVGAGSSANFVLSHGFWQEFTAGAPYVCGDANASGGVDIDDVVYLIAYIFAGGPPPDPYESGDANCSGAVDIDDVVYLIAYIFSGGNAPCDPDGDLVPDC